MICAHSNRRGPGQPANCSRTVAAPPEIAGLLLPGERVLTDPVAANGWRFESTQVAYERKTLLVGGPLLFALTGLGSAIRNRNARRAAEAQATAQWRPLGALVVVSSTARLLVLHQQRWSSVWLNAVTRVGCDSACTHLWLEFEDDPPYCLSGDGAHLVEVMEALESQLREWQIS